MNAGHRSDIPVFVASLGPRNVELTAEIAGRQTPVTVLRGAGLRTFDIRPELDE